MTVAAIVLSLFALSGAVGALWAVWRVSEAYHSPDLAPYDDRAVRTALDQLHELATANADRIDRIRADYKQLVIAVDEGIQNVRRRENRVRASIRRAQEELEAHGLDVPSITAEATELREIDGAGGHGEQLQLVQPSVEDSPPPAAGVPGAFTADELRALRGA